MLQSFAGLDAIATRKAAGFNVEPPDEGLGASSTRVVNFVNVVGQVYHTNGAPIGAPFYLNRFFKEPDAANMSDPRVFYDAASRRWFATMVEYRTNADFTRFTESHVDLAVSTSARPRGTWKVYRIATSNRVHAGCPCLADYPILGVSGANVYVSTSEFQADIASGPPNGAQLYAVSKRQLVAGATAPRIAAFENLSVAGSLAGHVQPANTYGPAAAEYLLSSIDPNSTSGHQLAVWAVTNEGALTSGHGHPLLSVRVVDSEGYAFPPKAQTPPGFCPGNDCQNGAGAPTTGVVDTDSDEMQEVQYIDGRLVGALNTGLSVAGDTADRSGIAWFVISPRVSGGTVDRRTHVVRQGYLALNGQYLLYPHINMVSDRSMALVFGLGGPGTFLSSAYATAAPGLGFGRIRIARAGTGPDNGFVGTDEFGGIARWGDYSNGEILPGTRRVWLATQDIPNQGTGNENWGNNIFELGLP